ncbi:dUTP diphosphatase [Buchnera aphidicola]|uniref:dUTP diphosphatase n=1 Tax=Buchnera aphidicola TaxID=9 RepID=UPI002238697E|nr:dUTP diphosphatase [Buchnera aphidicola]MCW5197452.1 dUTP diphosphatase [Buchnera aphidicola (Chaitophorus viminalis)]
MKNINIKILNKNIKNENFFPKPSTLGSAGIDLRACIIKKFNMKPNHSYLFSTGISIYIKDTSLAAIILPRSGLGHKYGIVLGNTVGLIDSDYQGEIMISLWNRSNNNYYINPYDRIAQMIFIKVEKVQFKIVQNFVDTSARGENGFGHTGL